jgi:hypothetical protein
MGAAILSRGPKLYSTMRLIEDEVLFPEVDIRQRLTL